MRAYIFICIFFVSGCTSSYHEHFFHENPEFSISEKSIVSGESTQTGGSIESLPNKTTQDALVRAIQNAQKRIWIEIYTWTDAAKLADPILQARKRGVDVRVVLEGNVFGTPKINAPIYRKFKQANISVAYADNHRYSFTHAKFWIIDDAYSISTGNWTASFFTKNREYIYTNNDTKTLRFLEEIFIADMDHMSFKDLSQVPPYIVISPLDARAKIERLILSTQKKIIFYVQTLDDERIFSLIDDLYSQKKDIKICTADNESNQEGKTKYPSWNWKLIKKPYLHAKVILVDDSTVFIGSHNLTTNAIENNREMGIILDHRDDIIHQIESDFILDGCR